MRKLTYLTLSLLVFTLLSKSATAQSDVRIQSVFMYNFTRLIAWPAEYQRGDFVIAVYGNSDMNKEVQDMAATKRAGNQSIVAANFNSIDEISKCHILYVPSSQSRRVSDIVEALKAKNINALVVTDTRNGINNGATINFTVENNRQRFELSQDNAKKMGLNPGGEISRLAILAD